MIKFRTKLALTIIWAVFLCIVCTDGRLSAENSSKELTSSDAGTNLRFDKTSEQFHENTNSSASSALLKSTIKALIIVSVLGTAAYFVIKKTSPTSAALRSRGKIKIIESTGLGRGKVLHLIEIEGRRLLIGSSLDKITKIADLTDFGQSLAAEIEE